MGLTRQEISIERDAQKHYFPTLPSINNPYPDESDGCVCQGCLSDHLSEDDIKPDGLCIECTECTECEKCGDFKLQDDMANEVLCCDCAEYFHRDVEQNDNFERTHGYGIL